jgi:hypothetical protein
MDAVDTSSAAPNIVGAFDVQWRGLIRMRSRRLPTSATKLPAGTKAAAGARSRLANHAAHQVASAIEDARRELGDDASLHAIARHLEAHGVPTPRCVGWTATAVRRALARIAARS